MSSDIHLLDCTLRDGGYYNQWDFEPHVVYEYLTAIADSGISLVELGFRNFGADNFKGPFFYTTDEFLETLSLPPGIEYGVMVDAKELIEFGDVEKAVKELFVSSEHSKISFVRFACRANEVVKIVPAAQALIRLGYTIFINLMQVANCTPEQISDVLGSVHSMAGVRGFYLADSLGNMSPNDISRISTLVRESWNGEIGFHAHDNSGRALVNVEAAITEGMRFIDVTVAGMGRGAGNLPTEKLLLSFLFKADKYKLEPISRLSIEIFSELKASFKWGESLFYNYGAELNVHPTYVQELLTNAHYRELGPYEIFEKLKMLQDQVSFKQDILASIFKSGSKVPGNARSLREVIDRIEVFNGSSNFTGKDLILVGAGPSIERYKSQIRNLLASTSCTNVLINDDQYAIGGKIDYVVTTFGPKLVMNKLSIADHVALICPADRLTNENSKALKNTRVFNWKFSSSKDVFELSNDGTCSSSVLTLAYFFGMCIAFPPRKIYLIGFDGYGDFDRRTIDTVRIIERFKSLKPDCALIALTPTQYPVEQDSLFRAFKSLL